METETEIDWDLVKRESREGRLMDVLVKIPRDKWNDRMPYQNWSLILFACRSDKNVPALITLIKQGANINDSSSHNYNWTPLNEAVDFFNVKIIEILLACQANVHLKGPGNLNAFEQALSKRNFEERHHECVKLFVANGFRLKSVCPHSKRRILHDLWLLEQGVLRCRNVIVTLLGLKKRGQGFLKQLDRFLLQQVLAVEIWTTRADEEWQPTF